MKSKFVVLLILAITIIGCSTREEVELNHPRKIRDYHNYIDSVISANSSVFGNVLILDSLGEAYDLLEHWSMLPYQDLRSEYSEYGFYSVVVESNIVYDSLFQVYGETYGLDDEDEVPSSMLSDMQSEVMGDYANLIPVKYVYDDELEREIGIIEPLADFDLVALTNENGIFVADSIVYKLYPNGKFLSFTISSYPQYAGYSFEAIQLLLAGGEYPDDLIPDLPNVYYHDEAIDPNAYPSRSHTAYSGDSTYRMNVSLSANAQSSKFYGTTTLSVNFKLKNYKKGWFGWFYWLTKLPTTGSYSFSFQAGKNHMPYYVVKQGSSTINENSSRITRQHIIGRYCDNFFLYPQVGFTNHSITISNGHIELNY